MKTIVNFIIFKSSHFFRISTLVIFTLSYLSVWGRTEIVELYHKADQYTSPYIDQSRSDNCNDFTSGTWGGFIRLNKQDTETECSLTFNAKSGTILKTYSFEVSKNGEDPQYKINNEAYQGAEKGSYKSVSNSSYNRRDLMVTTKSVQSKILGFIPTGSYYYINLRKFTFNVIIPEVVDLEDRTVALDRLKESDLNEGTITRTEDLTFQVKDPIDVSSPSTYFTAEITSQTGESWTPGPMTCSSTATDGKYTITVPITYTATNKESGNFEATVQLRSNNTISTDVDDCKVTIAVNVKQDYTINWNFGWNSDKQWIVDKGISYEREDYLINEESVIALGKTLSRPTSNNETVVKVNQETGEITMVGEGEATLTYVQPGDDEYNRKELTVGLMVQRKSPQFTIHSESTYVEGGKTYYVFYVNKTYTDFITSDNDSYNEYPMSVTHQESTNDQFITIGTVEDKPFAITHAVPKDGIEITVSQAEGDLWVGKEETIYISVRENPIHVGTLCNRTLEELFKDDNFTVDKTGNSAYGNGGIYVGQTAGGSTGGYVIFHFEGTPDKLQCDWSVSDTKGSNRKVTYYESNQFDGTYTQINSNTFKSTSRYLKVEVTGTEVQIKITSLCISEKVGVEFIPAEIDMKKMGEFIFTSNAGVQVSNLLNMNIAFTGDDASDFQIALADGNNNFGSTLSMDYTNGLGIDKSITVPIIIKYTGESNVNVEDVSANIVASYGETTYATAIITMSEITQIGDAPSVISPLIAENTSIYTGTECPSEIYPYKPKVEVNLSSCFDAYGTALFDQLYVFGLTTSTNDVTTTYEEQVYPAINIPTNPNNATTCFNATTPLYVYEKEGNSYKLATVYDATATRFDHGTSLNGKKIYITGYCPFAYMGTTANEEGWMYFKGGNTSVDIYLENCTMGGRYKTVNGCNRATDYSDFTLELGVDVTSMQGHNYITGCSSPFVFTSSATQTGTSFKPNIHIKGNSLLMGQTGMRISTVVGKVLVFEIDAGIGNVYQSSAPITIRATDKSGYTNLTFDDNWADGTITNGYLKLSTMFDSDDVGKYPCAKVGSIDLGNDAGSVTFNGGQYCLRNGHADGTYSTNMAISYRMYTKEAEKAGITATIYLYGFGGDQGGGGNVTINSGTFTKVQQDIKYGVDYYRDQDNFTDLRFPEKTKINGGTFNGLNSVVACADANSQGTNPLNGMDLPLTLLEVPTNGTTSYGSKTFDYSNIILLENMRFADVYTQSPIVATEISSNMSKVVASACYGGQSLNEDMSGNLNICVPMGEVLDNSRIRQWAACVPEFGAGSQGQNVTSGGDVEIEKEIKGVNVKTNQFLYMELNDEMLDPSVSVVEGEMTITAQTTRANVVNTGDYDIQKHLNLVKAIEADKWITFVAPFDIQQVTVLEHRSIVSETTLAKLEKHQAVLRQAKAYLQMFYAMSDFILPDANGRTTSITMPELLYLVKPDNLIHYDGTNIREAHYYLYELDNLNPEGYFSSSVTGNDLEISWKPVGPVEQGQTLMKKGHVYAMQFPYCPLCGDEDTRTTYDYWSGKYIWFYGKGPQTISGSNAHTSLINHNLDPGTAILKGNSTFKNMSLSAGSAYVHNILNDLFEMKNTTYSAKPLEAFMLYNPLAARMPKAISRSGKMIYEEQTATGLPTIGDRTTLNAYANNMQIHLTALQAQRIVIYDMHGQVLFEGQLMEGEQMSISAPQGIYIVKGTYEIIKLIVD